MELRKGDEKGSFPTKRTSRITGENSEIPFLISLDYVGNNDFGGSSVRRGTFLATFTPTQILVRE